MTRHTIALALLIPGVLLHACVTTPEPVDNTTVDGGGMMMPPPPPPPRDGGTMPPPPGDGGMMMLMPPRDGGGMMMPPPGDGGGMMGPRSCASNNDCANACPAGATGCACAMSPMGMICIPTCTQDRDCPTGGPMTLRCDAMRRVCVPAM